jgi:uncharacterized membrane protein
MKGRLPLGVIAATLVGMCLRFINLDANPLWMDEALLGCGYLTHQEFIGNLLVVHNDFWLRFPYALAGTLTIPAIYIVLKHKNLWVCWFIAVFPLFVFWSRLARPYALAGLFVVLAWRWWWMMIPALLQTPAALLGLRFAKKFYVLGLVVVAVCVYLVRPDSDGRFFDTSFLFYNPRIWYVPTLAGLLYLCDYLLPFLVHRYPLLSQRE